MVLAVDRRFDFAGAAAVLMLGAGSGRRFGFCCRVVQVLDDIVGWQERQSWRGGTIYQFSHIVSAKLMFVLPWSVHRFPG